MTDYSVLAGSLGTPRPKAACEYRTPVVADYRTARQVFQNEHGERTVS